MSIEIRLPNITGATEREQLAQVKSYLYQLAQQLQWAMGYMETSNSTAVKETKSSDNSQIGLPSGVVAQSTFNAIKPLIINSAEIVNSYYEAISQRLEGEYVAVSDFGTYSEKTAQEIEANSTGIESLYSNVQQIITDIETLEYNLIEVNAHIRSGLLYYDDGGVPIYGVEVGQKNVVDGVEVFSKYARFTSDRLSFYDQNDVEVAYISDRKLYISDVEVLTSIKRGGLKEFVLSNGDTVEKWVGRG